MSRLRFSRRDIIVLVSIAWGVALIYCGYLLVLKVQDMRGIAIIEANRTRNDIVVDNMRNLERALLKYGDDNQFKMPTDLDELVNGRYIRKVPTNPFTGQKTRLVRFGHWDHAGEVSAVMGRQAIYDKEDKLSSESSILFVTCYGVEKELLTKYIDWFPNAFCDFRQFGFDWLPAELTGAMITISGGYTYSCKRQFEGRYECTSLEDALRTEGYTLPIQMDPRDVVAEAAP